MPHPTYPCPCCGYLVFGEPPGSFDICPICFWEDDAVQLGFPDMAGGANGCSLIEGQQSFAEFGACEQRFKRSVRAPGDSVARDSDWRRLDPERDRYLKWEAEQDHQLWRSAKHPETSLYYWRPEFWLLQQSVGGSAGAK